MPDAAATATAPASPEPSECEFHAGLKGGDEDRVYANRDYTYSDVAGLEGCWHLRTLNGGRREGVSFSLPVPSAVLVLFDYRAKEPPSWLASWTRTGLVVKTTDVDMNVFGAVRPAGRVELGGLGDTGAKSMYAVLVAPLSTAAPAGAASGSGSGSAGEPEPADKQGSGRPTEPHDFPPDAPELGVDVGGGWRMIVSQEGRRGSIWDTDRARKCAKDGMAEYDARGERLVWRPRYHKDSRGRWDNWDGNPSSTVWKQFPRTALRDGVSVRMRFSSKRDSSMPRVRYSERWNGGEEDANDLRCVAGTGDFRVGLIQTNGRKDPGQWHVWQVRIYPYLHRDAKKHLGASDTSNCSYWYRYKPGGRECLVDDFSQDDDRDGFKKLRHRGQLKFGMGPHSPFDKDVDVEFKLRATGKSRIDSSVSVNRDAVDLDPYEHDTSGFPDDFTHVDAVCWSFNNMRPYCDIGLKCVGW
eukprot:jgi/Tetstr1/464090/TSEL_008895.t1